MGRGGGAEAKKTRHGGEGTGGGGGGWMRSGSGELARYQYSLDQLEGIAEEVKAELNNRGKLSDNLQTGKKNVWHRIM